MAFFHSSLRSVITLSLAAIRAFHFARSSAGNSGAADARGSDWPAFVTVGELGISPPGEFPLVRIATLPHVSTPEHAAVYVVRQDLLFQVADGTRWIAHVHGIARGRGPAHDEHPQGIERVIGAVGVEVFRAVLVHRDAGEGANQVRAARMDAEKRQAVIGPRPQPGANPRPAVEAIVVALGQRDAVPLEGLHHRLAGLVAALLAHRRIRERAAHLDPEPRAAADDLRGDLAGDLFVAPRAVEDVLVLDIQIA